MIHLIVLFKYTPTGSLKCVTPVTSLRWCVHNSHGVEWGARPPRTRSSQIRRGNGSAGMPMNPALTKLLPAYLGLELFPSPESVQSSLLSPALLHPASHLCFLLPPQKNKSKNKNFLITGIMMMILLQINNNVLKKASHNSVIPQNFPFYMCVLHINTKC